MEIFLFRVESGDNPELNQGTVIKPTGQYREYLNNIPKGDIIEYKKEMEDTLAKVQGQYRRNFLFLFFELKDALIFSSKIYHGNAIIYAVSCHNHNIVYRGDMNTLDSLTLAMKLGMNETDPDMFDSLCRHYWKRGNTFSPCYEILVNEAKINNIVCDKSECKLFHSEYFAQNSIAFLSVERTSIYIQKLNQIIKTV